MIGFFSTYSLHGSRMKEMFDAMVGHFDEMVETFDDPLAFAAAGYFKPQNAVRAHDPGASAGPFYFDLREEKL
jgi:hypothetical protein